MKLFYGLILLFLIPVLAGCEQLGLETPAAQMARDEAEGKAIGGGCRQAGRGLEDCYQVNRRAPKAAIYSGWRDMDVYMRENNLGVASSEPQMQPPQAPPQPKILPQSAVQPPEPTQDNSSPAQKQSTSRPASTPAKRAIKS
ncbi:MAG: hypothetical protein K9J42_06855 [Sulfuritalea sp.]|nr:hypothetical protein [Sulfuritalea sp.]